jgi:hypothetical protein
MWTTRFIGRWSEVGELEAAAEVDGGHDLAPEVDEAPDHRGGQRHPGHLLVADDLLYLPHADAEAEALDIERAELALSDLSPPAAAGSNWFHVPARSTASRRS